MLVITLGFHMNQSIYEITNDGSIYLTKYAINNNKKYCSRKWIIFKLTFLPYNKELSDTWRKRNFNS